MAMFRSTMRGMDKISLNHLSDVDKALAEARRRTQTRQDRAFNRVGDNIRRHLNM